MPAPGPNPYEILKVPRDASSEDIEDAYDRLFDRYEPKAQAGDQASIEMLNALNDAREILVDPQRRAAFDKALSQQAPVTATATSATGSRPARAPQPRPAVGRARTQNSELRTQNYVRARPRARYVETKPQRSLTSMIPFIIIIAFLLFALAVGVTYLLNKGGGTVSIGNTTDSSGTVATVNDQPIYQDDFNQQVNTDQTNALSDPMFGALFNNFQGITGTRALNELKFDSLDKLINMQVIMQEAKKEGNYPTDTQIDGLVQQAQQSDLQGGQTFDSFLQQHNISADQYRRSVTQNVVYEVMANEHIPATGTSDEKSQGFIDWFCSARQNYNVKILIDLQVTNDPPCTSGLPSDLPLPGVDLTQVPEPIATTGDEVTTGTGATPQSSPQATLPAAPQATPQATTQPTSKAP